MNSVGDGGWLTLREAASAYNVSLDTMRRRMRAGKFESRLEPSANGPTWLVWVDEACLAKARAAKTTLSEVVARIERLERVVLEYPNAPEVDQRAEFLKFAWELRDTMLARRLWRGGFRSVAQVTAASDPELLHIWNFGPVSLERVRAAVARLENAV